VNLLEHLGQRRVAVGHVKLPRVTVLLVGQCHEHLAEREQSRVNTHVAGDRVEGLRSREVNQVEAAHLVRVSVRGRVGVGVRVRVRVRDRG